MSIVTLARRQLTLLTTWSSRSSDPARPPCPASVPDPAPHEPLTPAELERIARAHAAELHRVSFTGTRVPFGENYIRESVRCAGEVFDAARFLDAVRPGWYSELDLDRLNMNNVCDCALGQLYGEYSDGYHQLYEHLNAPPQLLTAFSGSVPDVVWRREVEYRLARAR